MAGRALVKAVLSATLVALLPACAALAQARPGNEAAAIAGAYHLTASATGYKCILLLRADQTAGGMALGFLPQCRSFIPALIPVAAWSMTIQTGEPRVRLRLNDAKGDAVLDFATAGPKDTVTTVVGGATYTLAPGDKRSLAVKIDGVKAARPAANPAAAAPSPRDVQTGLQIPGIYDLKRARGAATGCVTELQAEGAPARAIVRPGCADAGVNTFSPTGWNLTGGTLWLTNAKGQRLSFERNRNGGWDKGAGQGETLTLIKQP